MRDDAKLVIIPAGNSTVHEYRINYKKILSITAIFLIFTGVTAFYAINGLTDLVNDSKVQSLKRANQVLKSHISQLNGRIDSLFSQMSYLQSKDDDIRLLMDLPDLDADIREVGVGGAKTDIDLGTNLAGFFLDDYSRTSLLNSYEKIEQLERQLKFEMKSYANLSQLVRNKKDSLKYLPAIFPTEGNRLTDGFGMRRHPITGRNSMHEGLDIAAKIGKPVYATADGVVKFIGNNGGYGKSVFINHKYGFQTRYAHLNKYLVSTGQFVKRGDIIGEVGNSGRSTGSHLHYEVRFRNVPLDPKDYFFDARYLQ